jgi:hypothetical protein
MMTVLPLMLNPLKTMMISALSGLGVNGGTGTIGHGLYRGSQRDPATLQYDGGRFDPTQRLVLCYHKSLWFIPKP